MRLYLFVMTCFLSFGSLRSSVEAQVAAPQSFEVASVRKVPKNRSGQTTTAPFDSDRFAATNATLEYLIQVAYGVNDGQITHKPDWLGAQQYDIEARSSHGRRLSYEEMKPLIQHLLEERFKLTYQRKSESVPGFVLRVAANGAHLVSSKSGSAGGAIMVNGIEAHAITMPQFAAMLWTPLGRPVEDETHLQGQYDISIKFASLQGISSDQDQLPSFFQVVQDELGLKLVPQKIPLQMFVIDHVDSDPIVD